MQTSMLRVIGTFGLLVMSAVAVGCTSLEEYVQNGFKVGPNYRRPPAPVAPKWIDATDVRVRSQSDDLSKWWTVFNDPVLDSLVCFAYGQNLSLRVAGCRVLESRAQLAIDAGNLLPQTQTATLSYTRNGLSKEIANSNQFSTAKRWFQQWNDGFNLSWEIDFWGRFRRTVEADVDTLDASVENYDDVLVTLLGDVATNYAEFRTFEQRIEYTKQNVELQRNTLKIVQGRFQAGTTNELDVVQARSTLEQTEAQIPELQIALRQTANQLCILLGIPPEDLEARLGRGAIPTAPPDVAIGIPADLLRRRPDVRRAERQAAAQSALIGVADAEFYPHIVINGTIGYSAEHFKDLFREKALMGSVGPSFTWNILNYGRILNNVRLQDARFQELVATYQNTVAERRPGRGERSGDFPARAGAYQAAGGERGRRRARRHDRACPVHGRDDRSHHGHAAPAEPRGAARHAGTSARRNRHRPGTGLPGPGRRLADPHQRLPNDRSPAQW